MHEADRAEAGRWLARHGLAETEPSPLLAARLAVRRRAKLFDSLLLAGFLLGAALTHVLALGAGATSSWPPLLVLAALVAGLLGAQWLLAAWVRRADQRAGARLPRRVALPVRLGWQAVLGRPYALFTAATFAAAMLLAVSVLPVSDPGLRYGATVVLIGLAGAGTGIVLQVRQVLASPAVAEDEASLTADVIMRVEDARALVTPSLVWSLPAIFLYGESLGWWNAASVALVVAGVIALSLVHHRAAGVATAARRAMATR
ncbi:hypothetical protein [Actinomadura livida]|uniref:MFS family permease n=1 Tax=Actinomadura livida TaxID=79909 RepID=A0A7W7I896_9ACTN|nr:MULTISPECIES: hypothetical protein [Actinomadura]MBB4772300.1 MFS family permease [Actinomadura catellatispora]GGU28348.1 hypothetical protein GCM10010208_61550 [Actinomadura livida]